MKPVYAIGIDLGTTNCALAFCPLDQPDECEMLPIPQMVSNDTLESHPLLPSFLYLATDPETEAETFTMPGLESPGRTAGIFARGQAALVPSRTVATAKSWLCHNRVDRHQPLLPWQAPEDVRKISPVDASAHYLRHLAAAWDQAHPEAPMKDQVVTLTVPASFDAGARELTRQAAAAAGLPETITLLEEPQAALYAWLSAQGDAWRKNLAVGDRLLVCDIGGGTSDFTLIGVEDREGDLELNRVAVGNHILVGGDNMDLALAHAMQTVFREQGQEIDAWQSVALWHACRQAKETLLSDPGLDQCPVTILGRGSRLVGGTITAGLTRDMVMQVLTGGFFPECGLDERPHRAPASGFRQIGLPYEADPAISRHLAGFLSAHAGPDAAPTCPTHVLFNGGVCKADAVRDRIHTLLAGWFPETGTPAVLETGSGDLDFAVARGAAGYGCIKHGGGIRIRGGTARSYYIGIESSGLAIPGQPRPLHALCVVPHGMEEGTSTDVPGSETGLIVGEPARFRFFTSSVRTDDLPGARLTSWSDDELQETDPLEANLRSADHEEDGFVPVRLESRITELGILELWCRSTIGDEQWKLEFSVREDQAS